MSKKEKVQLTTEGTSKRKKVQVKDKKVQVKEKSYKLKTKRYQ